MLRIRLDFSYDGTDFAGWARQPGLRTVEGLLREALTVVLRASAAPRVTVAGRTDAGVHARGQVAHVDVEEAAWGALSGLSRRTAGEALVARLGGLLPRDVVVHTAELAPPGFDARFSPLRRRYAYRIADDPTLRDPLRRMFVLWHRRPLDVAAMHDAARPLVGQHDFAAFSKPREGATTIRTLEIFDWERPTSGADAGLVLATVQADAFCHNMVRALVGASLAVGEGRRPRAWPAAVLAAGLREPAAGVASPVGLTLEQVTYPDDAELAARAHLTRNHRVPQGFSGGGP
ncbi:tRNA pseudouridine(38-40) synthase TruA [Pengzhenrongella sp.]|uniref:tRNA pseudouridine(38-40) synthase TruA n=1 Tax=Pengzhenrongella sp. TaxID=2888820 RepID=UPI002F929C21